MANQTVKATYIVDVKDGELKSLNKEMEQFQKNAKNNNDAIKKNQTSLQKSSKITAGAVAGYAALGLALKKAVDFSAESIEAYNEQAIATARLESIAYGVANATEVEVEALKKLADEYQKVTTFGDEVIESGQSQILSFGVTADQAGQLTGSLTDLLAANKGVNATSQDAIEASNMLGKALNGQAGALSRAGILMTDRQKKLVQEGDQSTRVAAIVEVMNDNYGGLAETLAKTDAGQLIQTNNEIGDMMERIGGGLIPVQTELANLQSVLVSKFAGTEDGMNSVGDAITRVARVFTASAEQMFLAGEITNGVFAGLMRGVSMLPFASKEFKAFADAYADESRNGIQDAFKKTKDAYINVIGEIERSDSVVSESTKTVNENTDAIISNTEAQTQQSALITARKKAWQEIQTFQFSVQDREVAKTNQHFQDMLALFEGNGKAQIAMRTEIENEWTRVLNEIQVKRDEDAKAKEAEQLAEAQEKRVQQIDDFTSYANTINDIVQSMTTLRIAGIDAQEDREIKAIENSTKSEEQKAKEIEKIEEKASKEKQKVMMADWSRSIAMIQVNTALGMAKTWANVGYPGAIPLTIAMGAASTVATATAVANKPKFEDGGIVGGNSFTGDQVDARVNSGEMILNKDQQANLFAIANGGGGSTTHNITVNAVSSDGVEDAILSALYNAQENNRVDNTRLSIGAE